MRLSQIIALEKETKTRSQAKFTELHKTAQKGELFNGHVRIYRKKDEYGEEFPNEEKKVQQDATTLLNEERFAMKDFLDLTFSKDLGNCKAKANIVINGNIIAPQVPVTTLLTLEKHFTDVRTFISKMPILDPGEDWEYSSSELLYKAEPTQTHRTKKNNKVIVLHPPTEHHPAQTQLIVEDEIVGYWHTTRKSGALSEAKKKELLERVESLIQAIKSAREEANCLETSKEYIADSLYNFLLN